MSSYHAVQEALAERLRTVEIDEDLGQQTFAQQIAQVFVDPPASIEPGLLPCIVLGDAPFDDDWASSYALELYRQQCGLLLRDEDAAVAVQLCNAYRGAIRDVLRRNVKLGLSHVTVSGVSFNEVELFPYAGHAYFGFVFEVAITVNDTDPGFAADSLSGGEGGGNG